MKFARECWKREVVGKRRVDHTAHRLEAPDPKPGGFRTISRQWYIIPVEQGAWRRTPRFSSLSGRLWRFVKDSIRLFGPPSRGGLFYAGNMCTRSRLTVRLTAPRLPDRFLQSPWESASFRSSRVLHRGQRASRLKKAGLSVLRDTPRPCIHRKLSWSRAAC